MGLSCFRRKSIEYLVASQLLRRATPRRWTALASTHQPGTVQVLVLDAGQFIQGSTRPSQATSFRIGGPDQPLYHWLRGVGMSCAPTSRLKRSTRL